MVAAGGQLRAAAAPIPRRLKRAEKAAAAAIIGRSLWVNSPARVAGMVRRAITKMIPMICIKRTMETATRLSKSK